MGRRILLTAISVLVLTVSYYGQGIDTTSRNDNDEAQRDILLRFDLQALEVKAGHLEGHLAQARAKAEIGAATWMIDRMKAQKLLREAYELTFPAEEEQIKLRDKPVGAEPTLIIGLERARNDIRDRVLSIALRDKVFADELVQLGAKQLGRYEEHFRLANLAHQAFEQGDKEIANQYIFQSIAAEPTQGTAVFVILEVAEHDRPAGDMLIIQYIEQLRAFQATNGNYELPRVFYFLLTLIFPGVDPSLRQARPGPAATRAFISYILETMSKREQLRPGSIRGSRGYMTIVIWPLLQQYAPELTPTFMQLEKLSRRPGEDGSLPTAESIKEKSQDQYERRLKAALKDEHFEEAIIYSAISRGDYGKVRKLIAKLDDGPQKAQFTDMVNMREALGLVAAGDLPGAERLAEQLTRATSIEQVYPALINKCGAHKDVACASALVYQAMKQLKRAETAPPTPPAGIPASAFMSNRELDPVLSSLSKLAQAVLPLNESLGFEVLDEAVQAANVSEMDTGLGRTGFDVSVFKQFAAKNDARMRQAAETFKDPLRQIVALAAIYQRQADELTKRAARKAKPAAVKP